MRRHDVFQVADATLEAIYDLAPIGLAVIGVDGRFVRINRWLAGINGVPVERHIGRTLEEVVPNIAPACRAVIAQVLKTGEGVYDWLVSGETASEPGVLKTWLEQWSPLKDESGNIVAINVVVEDVTKSQQAQRTVLAGAAFTRRVLDNLFTFVGVLDLDGRLIEANRAPIEVAGLSASDVIGRKFWDCHWWSYSKAEQDRLRTSFERCLAGEVVRYDVPVLMAQERLLWIDFQMSPLRDEQGNITHVIPSGNDIQARRAAEESLRLQQAETAALLQSAPIGLAFFDRHYRYLRINQELAEINGVPVDEHIGRTIEEVLPSAPGVTGLIDAVFETAAPVGNIEVTGETRREPGVRRYWLTGFFPVAATDGQVAAVGIWVVEITDRKHDEEKIRLLMREVNHRSKNLLSVVQAIARQTLPSAEYGEAAQHLSDRLLALAASHDLLVRNSWEGAQLEDLIRSQLSHLGQLMDSRILLSGDDLLVPPAAAQTIGMALHELVTNASKYGALSNDAGRVKISWSSGAGPDGLFTLDWHESGGPLVTEPKRQGFGSLLLSRLTGLGLGGRTVANYMPDGLYWRLEVPVSALKVTQRG